MAEEQVTDAEREGMLDRMLTRLALAEDSQLQTLLAKILPYSIRSLNSPSPSVRKLVMEILTHVNKRVKHQLDIGLPLLELWKMYREASINPMIRNFCIIYIEMAFQRLPLEEKANMAPELIDGLSKLPMQHQDIILRIASKVIGECHSNKIDEKISQRYKMIGNVKDREVFIEFCLYMILYHPPSPSAACPSGLSVCQSERVTGKLPLTSEILLTRKLGILNVLNTMDVAPELVYSLYIAAASDSQEPVVKRGEVLLKKITAGVNLEDSDLLKRLFLLFNGHVSGTNDVGIAAESRVTPGSYPLKLRLMSIFCRSIKAANSFPSTLQCIFSCIYGTGTTARLKQLGMEFAVWVFKHAANDQLNIMGPVILSGILRSLDVNANSDSEVNQVISKDVKSFAYQAIGLLAVRLPHLFREKTDMAVRLFNALKVEDQSLRFTIQEATTTLSVAYKEASTNVLKELEELLLENSRGRCRSIRLHSGLPKEFWAEAITTAAYLIKRCPSTPLDRKIPQEVWSGNEVSLNHLRVFGCAAYVLKEKEKRDKLDPKSEKEQSEARFCALRWACSLYDMENCPSRFICMIGTSDSKLDIREMASEGLSLMEDSRPNSRLKGNTNLPKLKDMLDYIFKQQPKLFDSSATREHNLLFPSKMYYAIIAFLMKCFHIDFGQSGFCTTPETNSCVAKLCLLLEHAMATEGSVQLHATASKALVTIGSCIPELIAQRYSERITWLKQLLSHIDSDTREAISRLLGIACSAIPPATLSSLITELVSSINTNQTLRFEIHHGALCAIGYTVAECIKANIISDVQLQSTVSFLINVIETEGDTLASVSMEAIAHIGLRCPLPKLVHSSFPGTVEILTILEGRLRKILSGDCIKAIQKTVISLGHLSVNETSFSHINIALELIFSLYRSKVEDILFACGEALSFIWGEVPVTADTILKSNFKSLSETSSFLTSEVLASELKSGCFLSVDANKESLIMAREVITRKLFDSLLYSSRKEERCAGTVWLVSLIMYCGHHPKIQQLLPEIQEAFSHLLGEQNELTQELASQGMSIVYELGDSSMKQDLVNNLVGTLTGSGKRKRVVKLTEDTEVFQEGAIGENLGGGKLSTYKELCSLANEMGQPDLVYKFMDLANYHASLNSKRGAAFGFSKIAKHAGDALKPHLGSLIPRLVRYQYDPDKNVQDSMGHIWKSIVTDSKQTIDAYFDSIIDDLLVQSSSRFWRSREASCRAIADLIQGRKFYQVSRHLKRIWIAAFRAMDDIKETVRNSGDSLCRAVSSLTARLCDVSLTSLADASDTMGIVLPLLLSEGIASKVASVQKASISMVMKLSKGAGVSLRPYLSDLVCCMLESLSSLEDQRLNYVELHAGNAGIQTDKLDNLRLSVAKDSPMWETLDLCLQVVDIESLNILVPRLAQMIRAGVGLNTRVGIANFITLLAQKVNASIRPFTSTLVKLLFHAVIEEKSGLAKRAFASASAIILKYAGPALAQKIIEDTASLHSGDRNSQLSCGILFKNYSSFASDLIGGYQATILPVSFISRFVDDKDVSSLFEDIWEEIASSERVSLQLYLSEIVSLLCDSCAASSWASKKKSAKAIRKLSEVLGESLSPSHDDLIQCLLKEMPGRLWEGKESILFALASICSSCHEVICTKDPTIPNAIINAILSACTKKVKSYREAAFDCVQEVVKAFNKPEFFTIVFPLLVEMCSKTNANKTTVSISNSTPENSGDGESDVAAFTMDKVVDCVTSCIHVAFLPDILEQRESIIFVFSHALSPEFSWPVKSSVFSSIKELCSKFHKSSQDTPLTRDGILIIQELFLSVAPQVIQCIRSINISQIHDSAADCLQDVIEMYKNVPSTERNASLFKDDIIELCELEKNEHAKSLLRSCINGIESFNDT